MLHRRPQSSVRVALVRSAQVELGDIRLTTRDAGKIVDVNEVLFLGDVGPAVTLHHHDSDVWGLSWGCFHGSQTRNHDNNSITLRLSGTRMRKEPGIGIVPTCFLAYQWSNRNTCNSLLGGCWFCRKWIKIFQCIIHNLQSGDYTRGSRNLRSNHSNLIDCHEPKSQRDMPAHIPGRYKHHWPPPRPLINQKTTRLFQWNAIKLQFGNKKHICSKQFCCSISLQTIFYLPLKMLGQLFFFGTFWSQGSNKVAACATSEASALETSAKTCLFFFPHENTDTW